MKNKCLLTIIIMLLISDSVFALSDGYASTLTDLFLNLDGSLQQIWTMLNAVAYLTGFMMTIAALYRLKKFGERTAFMHNSKGLIAPAAYFLVGIMLMYMPTFLETMNATVFGTGYIQSAISWQSSNTGLDWANVVAPLVTTIQVVGLIAFIRGWILLTRVCGEQPQPGMSAKGVIHIVGGVLAINITGTMDAISATFGL